MPKARKRPVVVDVERYNGTNADAIVRWIEFTQGRFTPAAYSDGVLTIATLEGQMTVSPGDYVIKGVAGEFYPCRADIFATTYEPVEG